MKLSRIFFLSTVKILKCNVKISVKNTKQIISVKNKKKKHIGNKERQSSSKIPLNLSPEQKETRVSLPPLPY